MGRWELFREVFWTTLKIGIIACVVLWVLMHWVYGGIFGRDKIPYDQVVEDTIVVKIDYKEYAVVCFDGLSEGKLYDCYIVKIEDFLECIDDTYVERKPKPTPTVIPTYYPTVDNKPLK